MVGNSIGKNKKVCNIKTEERRIDFKMPSVPTSLREFIEKAVKDENTMKSFIETPIETLRAAGVPIQENGLTQGDIDHVISVIGKLRDLVNEGTISSDFKFEDVFDVSGQVFYEQSHEKSDSYCTENFEPSTSCKPTQHREGGIREEFNSQSGILDRFRDERSIKAPLISPGDLAEITTVMQAKLRKFSK